MKHTIRGLSAMMVVYGCFCLPAATCRGDDYAPRVGQAHPDFTLPRIADGKPVSLSQFRGRKVLLIHLASW